MEQDLQDLSLQEAQLVTKLEDEDWSKSELVEGLDIATLFCIYRHGEHHVIAYMHSLDNLRSQLEHWRDSHGVER